MRPVTVTCGDYRAEQRLLALKRQLGDASLTAERRRQIEAEIAELERQLKMD